MEVTGIFNLKSRGPVVSGTSKWNDNISHKPGDILLCGDKQWKVVAVDHFHQGCFGVPTYRHHGLKLEPISHNEQPQVGDVLVLV